MLSPIIQVLILDEADRLLDMGFKRDLDAIMSFIPQGRPVSSSQGGGGKRPGGGHPVSTTDKPRQTLLFSATFSREVREIAASFLRQGYQVVDTVGEEVEQTHEHVTQVSAVANPTAMYS